MSQRLKPSLRIYSATAAEIVRFSEAVNESGASAETKQRLNGVANKLATINEEVGAARGDTYLNAHQAWQSDHAGRYIAATIEAKEILSDPAIKREVKDIDANPGSEMHRIYAEKLVRDCDSLIKSEKVGLSRDAGAYSQALNPLVQIRKSDQALTA